MAQVATLIRAAMGDMDQDIPVVQVEAVLVAIIRVYTPAELQTVLPEHQGKAMRVETGITATDLTVLAAEVAQAQLVAQALLLLVVLAAEATVLLG